MSGKSVVRTQHHRRMSNELVGETTGPNKEYVLRDIDEDIDLPDDPEVHRPIRRCQGPSKPIRIFFLRYLHHHSSVKIPKIVVESCTLFPTFGFVPLGFPKNVLMRQYP